MVTSKKPRIDLNRVKLYLWLGLAYLLVWFLHDHFSSPGTLVERLFNHIWRYPYIVTLNFIFLEYALPYLRWSWKRILIGIVLIWIHLLLYSFGLSAWRSLGLVLHIYTPFPDPKGIHVTEVQFAYGFGSLVFFTVLRHIYDHIKLRQAAKQLRIEKQEAELNYLKSQTNPHFLFNTLNNIYALARNKSDLTPESILRLSGILRYMLYETNGDYVAIEQELKIINDYLSLESLRYDDSLGLNFNHDVDDMKQALPPLLLIPLVENAFKHGVSETRDHPFVDIHLSIKNRQLVFVVRNSTDIANGEKTIKENIGLSNLRRQLELLYKDYDLSVRQNGLEFVANLKINLASHV